MLLLVDGVHNTIDGGRPAVAWGPMSLALRSSRAVAAALAPVLLIQARRVKRDVPILPPAARPWNGTVDGPHPLRLLVFGDSTAVGVGVEHHREALAGHVADVLAERTGRGVHWRAVGESGATSRELLDRHLVEAVREPADVVLLSVGANDALRLRSRGAFARDVGILLRALRAASPGAVLILSSLPAFHRFTVFPQPLRRTLSLHTRSLESAARAVVEARGDATMSAPPPPYTDGFFARDGFHPSASGYRDWAHFALDGLELPWP